MNLILGTSNFCRDYGKRLEKDECFKILDRAKELGINTVATAFDYGIEVVNEYGWKDIIHKKEPRVIEWRGFLGMSIDEPYQFDGLYNGPLMAPFNPPNHSFKEWASKDWFIARSIFCGGKLQRSHPEDVAMLIAGFLKSHDVKNAVFGVESIEELEITVKAFNG